MCVWKIQLYKMDDRRNIYLEMEKTAKVKIH